MTEPDAAVAPVMAPLQSALTARPDVLLAWDEERGEAAATITPAALEETCTWLKEAQGFVRLSGVIGIDTLTYPVAMPGQPGRGTPRFGVIYHLAALPPGRRAASVTRVRAGGCADCAVCHGDLACRELL